MPEYPTGPGRRSSSRGAVLTAYADTGARDRVCPPPPRGCSAAIGEFCKHEGREKHIPCIARTKTEAS